MCSYCTKRTFNVTTNKDQLVNLRISTWDGRGMSQTCKGQFDPNSPVGLNGRYHIGYYSGGHFGSAKKGLIAFKMGDLDFGQVELKAGKTYTVNVELDWTDEEVARDFSVVAHGMSGHTVTIERSDKKASDKLPAITRKGSQDSNKADESSSGGASGGGASGGGASDGGASGGGASGGGASGGGASGGGTSDKGGDDTFSKVINKAFNKRVDDYQQWNNFGPCGAGHKWNDIGKEISEFIVKNTCDKYNLVFEY